jgi:hypothetical protein
VQMNEGDESNPSMETRKRKRCSGFRYSSTKDLERSRLKRRTAKEAVSQFASIMKALAYPSALCPTDNHHHEGGSSGPLYLDRVEEHDGKRMELSFVNAITYEKSPLKISIFYLCSISCFVGLATEVTCNYRGQQLMLSSI